MKKTLLTLSAFAALTLAASSQAQTIGCDEQPQETQVKLDDELVACDPIDPEIAPAPEPSPMQLRVLKYAAVAVKHKLSGLASYYSRSLDGTLTATGEIFRNKQLTAAHLTLPLGSWVEVTSRATGRKIRVRVNDRGPYAKKFMLDLSKAAAHALGVDIAEDRHVDVRIIALPGENPLPENWEIATTAPAAMAATTAADVAR
jgi:rare lipoprotein A